MSEHGNKSGGQDSSENAVKLYKRSIRRAVNALSYAEILLSKALKDYGPHQSVSYPDTAYFLPSIRTGEGEEITRLGQLPVILNEMRVRVKEDEYTFSMARQADESTAYASEIIETIYFLRNGRQGESWEDI